MSVRASWGGLDSHNVVTGASEPGPRRVHPGHFGEWTDLLVVAAVLPSKVNDIGCSWIPAADMGEPSDHDVSQEVE